MADERDNGEPTLGGHARSSSLDSSLEKENKSSSKFKDLSRPKRKKARRACAACQRAHLTCGDERPCERCVKRRLQDDCHDGARKKAKYLRDAPDEALQPGAGRYFQLNHKSAASPPDDGSSIATVPRSETSFLGDPQSNLASFLPMSGTSHRHSHSQQDAMQFNNFSAQAAALQNQPYNPQQQPPAQNMSTHFQPHLNNQAFMGSCDDTTFSGFDPSSINFGNQYGALEFGMLGHMASGANKTNNSMRPRTSSTFEPSPIGTSAYLNTNSEMNSYNFTRQESTGDWRSNDPRLNSWANQGASDPFSDGRTEPNTYSIGNAQGPYMGASPLSTSTDFLAPFDATAPKNGYSNATQIRQQEPHIKQEREHRPSKAVSDKLEQLPPTRTTAQRRHQARKIYTRDTQPYPYTIRFHALIAGIIRRFSSPKRLRIAKAIGAIRPSFISCTRGLIDEDLILMEKNFQRSLLEYEDRVNSCGTPTIICRRTGEVAYAGDSFVKLSGWSHGVLLGKEPNLNFNRGNDDEAPSGTMTGSSRGGFTTPRATTTGVDQDAGLPHPVFLMDLLDDDSVVHFYEDFAKIAFADSKGSATRACKLLKYKTKDDPTLSKNRVDDHGIDDRRASGMTRTQHANTDQSISRLGELDGMVDCMFCWTVKRDVFEFPMMIVINVSQASMLGGRKLI